MVSVLAVWSAVADPALRLRRIDAIGDATSLAGRDADMCATVCLAGRYFLIDALAARPGVTARQNGQFGGTATVRVRGAPSGHTLVLIDGVPVNDASTPNGAFDFARIGGGGVSGIEIYKGAEAMVWGAGAAAINIVSARPGGGRSVEALVTGGAYDTLAGQVSLSGGGDSVSGRLTVDGLASGGLSKAAAGTERDGFSRLAVSALWRVEGPAGTRLRGGVRSGGARIAYDGFDPEAPGMVGDADRLGVSREMVAHIGLSFGTGAVTSDFLAAATHIRRVDSADGIESFSAAADGAMVRYHADIALTERHRSSVGVSAHRSVTGDGASDRFALYGVHRITLGPTRIGLALRRESDSNGGGLGVGADIAHVLGPCCVLRAGWSRGYVAPTLFQRGAFFPPASAAAGAQLRPELSTGWTLGAHWQGESAHMRVTAFARQTEDQIAYDRGRYVNLDRSDSLGIELAAALDLTAEIRSGVSLTALTASQNGFSAPDLPGLSASAHLSAVHGRVSGILALRHVGAHRQSAGPVAGWTRFDVSASYRLTERSDVHVRIENLFDLRYQQVIGYGTPGLSAEIGISVAAGTTRDE